MTSAQDTRFACVLQAWQAHERELRASLRGRLRDDAAADDLLQDVFLKAMQQGEGFCQVANRRAWLYRVMRNAVVDDLRTRRPTEPLTDEVEAALPAPAAAMAPVDALAECLEQVIAELGPEDADVLRACELAGQTSRAYAARHGLTLSAAKARLLRARRRLRDRIAVSCQVRFDASGEVAGHAARRPQVAAEGAAEGAAGGSSGGG